jgi:carbon storage regulator
MTMLVLARKPGESVQIGDDVELRVLSVSGKRVRLGLVCPQGVRIMRSELMEHELATARPVLRATASAVRAGTIQELSPTE